MNFLDNFEKEEEEKSPENKVGEIVQSKEEEFEEKEDQIQEFKPEKESVQYEEEEDAQNNQEFQKDNTLQTTEDASSKRILIILKNPIESVCKGRIPSKRMKGQLELDKSKGKSRLPEIPKRNLKRKGEDYELSHQRIKFKLSI